MLSPHVVFWLDVFALFYLVLDDKARDLSSESLKYRKDAKYLNMRSSYVKIGAICIVVVLLLLFLRYFIF